MAPWISISLNKFVDISAFNVIKSQASRGQFYRWLLIPTDTDNFLPQFPIQFLKYSLQVALFAKGLKTMD